MNKIINQNFGNHRAFVALYLCKHGVLLLSFWIHLTPRLYTHGTYRLAEWADSPYPSMSWKWSIFELGAYCNLNIYARAAIRKISHRSEWNIFHVFHFPIPPFMHIAHMSFETGTHLYIAHVSSYYCTSGRLDASIMRCPAHSKWKKNDIMRAVMMKAVSVCVSGMYWYITGWYVSKHSR